MSRLLTPLLALPLLVGCGPADEPPATGGEGVQPLLLARHPELLTAVELPDDSRGGVDVPDRIPVQGPYLLRRTTGGVHSFETDLPIRLRSLFFIRPPDGMTLHLAGEEDPVTFRRSSRRSPKDGTWSFSARKLQAHLETDQPPQSSGFEMVYPRAVERERELNRQWAEVDDGEEFMLRSAWQDHVTRHGALLPAPARATWRVTVPARGRLSMELGLLEPEVADLEPSDGASLLVLVAAGGAEPVQAASFDVVPGQFETVRVDLSAWSGQQVDLTLVTHPGESARYDYVFAGEPTLYAPLADPPRVVLVFIDTLRADHLSLYGYDRDTMPRLDAWAADATVFEAARTPAPWTLPSVRALLLGAEPEYWGVHSSLAARLASAGWPTAAFVGNVYLSANFEMAGDWGHHYVENWPQAVDQVDQLQAWLKEHDDQPAVVMLHLMDTHLPYTEPRKYRRLWAGAAPDGLSGAFQRSSVVRSGRGKGKAEARKYVVDRYDGAIRYVDDQIARVLESLGPDDVAVVFSDHGEEFWDHKGFEHGHTLYEELLAVPLVIKAPGLVPGRVGERVSLVDVAPTLLELLGVRGDETISGLSLLSLARGEPSAVRRFAERLHAFGRPLYGNEQWGVLDGSTKWSTKAGREELYDLASDPDEQDDQARDRVDDLGDFHQALGRALDVSAWLAFRLYPDRYSGRGDLEVRLTVPGGVRTAWVGAEPTEKSAAEVSWEGELVTATWKGGMSGSREVFVVPLDDPQGVVPGLVFEASRGEQIDTASWAEDKEVPRADGRTRRLLQTRGTGVRVTLTYGVAPEPPEEGRDLGGYDPETASALQALGYIEDEDEPARDQRDEPEPGEGPVQ